MLGKNGSISDSTPRGDDVDEPAEASNGYVYILINASLQKNFLKIGQTTKYSEERANELSRGSGVVAPFMVAYDWEVSNCLQVEKIVHGQLAEFRVNGSREFFSIPLKEAIKKVGEIIDQYNRLSPDEIKTWLAETEIEIANYGGDTRSERSVPGGSGTYPNAVMNTGAVAGDILIGYKRMNMGLKIQIHEDINPTPSGSAIAVSFTVMEPGNGYWSEFIEPFVGQRFTYAGEMLDRIKDMPGGGSITHILNLNSLQVFNAPITT